MADEYNTYTRESSGDDSEEYAIDKSDEFITPNLNFTDISLQDFKPQQSAPLRIPSPTQQQRTSPVGQIPDVQAPAVSQIPQAMQTSQPQRIEEQIGLPQRMPTAEAIASGTRSVALPDVVDKSGLSKADYATIESLGGGPEAERLVRQARSEFNTKEAASLNASKEIARSLEQRGISRDDILKAIGTSPTQQERFRRLSALQKKTDEEKAEGARGERIMRRLEERAPRNSRAARALDFRERFDMLTENAELGDKRIVDFLSPSERKRIDRYYDNASFGRNSTSDDRAMDRLYKKAKNLETVQAARIKYDNASKEAMRKVEAAESIMSKREADIRLAEERLMEQKRAAMEREKIAQERQATAVEQEQFRRERSLFDQTMKENEARLAQEKQRHAESIAEYKKQKDRVDRLGRIWKQYSDKLNSWTGTGDAGKELEEKADKARIEYLNELDKLIPPMVQQPTAQDAQQSQSSAQATYTPDQEDQIKRIVDYNLQRTGSAQDTGGYYRQKAIEYLKSNGRI